MRVKKCTILLCWLFRIHAFVPLPKRPRLAHRRLFVSSTPSEEELYRMLLINTDQSFKDALKRNFRGLAKIYHPDNSESGNAEIFRLLMTLRDRIENQPLQQWMSPRWNQRSQTRPQQRPQQQQQPTQQQYQYEYQQQKQRQRRRTNFSTTHDVTRERTTTPYGAEEFTKAAERFKTRQAQGYVPSTRRRRRGQDSYRARRERRTTAEQMDTPKITIGRDAEVTLTLESNYRPRQTVSFERTQVCPHCLGSRTEQTESMHSTTISTCSHCAGTGVVNAPTRVELDIPRTTTTGDILLCPSHGHDSLGQGPRGDLYVRVIITGRSSSPSPSTTKMG